MSIDSRAKSYGKIWGGWTMGKLLGTGSGGKTAVFQLTRDNLTFTEHCAMKVVNIIDEQVSYDEISDEYKEYYLKRREEMRRAAEAEVNLMHQLKDYYNIVQYYDFEFNDWQEDGSFGTDLLIRMDLLGNLSARMKKEGVTQPEIVKIGIDICTALEACAEHNIIHRDIKPDNIFSNGRQYLLGDFGISKIIENGMGTQTNKGTAHYAAPEQFANATNVDFYDHRVDIYSLALTLYVLANKGKLPFTDQVMNNQLANQMRLTGRPFTRIDGINPELMDVILVGCSYKPEDRFKTATAFKNALLYVQDIMKKDEKAVNLGGSAAPSGSAESYETEEALASQDETEPALGVSLVQNDVEARAGYETEPALGMTAVHISEEAAAGYETEPALGMTAVRISEEAAAGYETEPALGMTAVRISEEAATGYETEPALGMTAVHISEEAAAGYETEPALGMTAVHTSEEAAADYETEPALEMTSMPKLSGQAYAQTNVDKTQQSIQNNLSQSQPVKPQAAMQQSVQPVPVKPQAAMQQSAQPVPVQPQAAMQQSAQPVPVQPQAAMQQSAQPVPVKPQVQSAYTQQQQTQQMNNATQQNSYVHPVQMSYVDMENLKGMAKTKIMADDRDGACAIFMQLSAAGDCNAMYTEISKIYNSNKEVKKNPETAIFWYQKCIDTIKDSWTVSLAENRLGEIYSNGLGVKKDHELAEKYYRSSASKGNPYAKKKFVAGKYVK